MHVWGCIHRCLAFLILTIYHIKSSWIKTDCAKWSTPVECIFHDSLVYSHHTWFIYISQNCRALLTPTGRGQVGVVVLFGAEQLSGVERGQESTNPRFSFLVREGVGRQRKALRRSSLKGYHSGRGEASPLGAKYCSPYQLRVSAAPSCMFGAPNPSLKRHRRRSVGEKKGSCALTSSFVTPAVHTYVRQHEMILRTPNGVWTGPAK